MASLSKYALEHGRKDKPASYQCIHVCKAMPPCYWLALPFPRPVVVSATGQVWSATCIGSATCIVMHWISLCCSSPHLLLVLCTQPLAASKVFHLPIEEAAKQLGIGQTMLKHYCRKFGIPRWPYRKRQSVVQLIQSIEEYAQVREAEALLACGLLSEGSGGQWIGDADRVLVLFGSGDLGQQACTSAATWACL